LPPSKTSHSPSIQKSHADIDFDSKATVFQHGISQKQTVHGGGGGGEPEILIKQWFWLEEYAWPHYPTVMSELLILAKHMLNTHPTVWTSLPVISGHFQCSNMTYKDRNTALTMA